MISAFEGDNTIREIRLPTTKTISLARSCFALYETVDFETELSPYSYYESNPSAFTNRTIIKGLTYPNILGGDEGDLVV